MSCEHPCPCCRYYTVRHPGCHEQCPVCGWTDSGVYNDAGEVWIDQAQLNFRELGVCCRRWLDSVTPPTQELRRAAPPFTLQEWKHALATQFVARARIVFGGTRRPRHFTSLHCCDECSEHDETMQAFDNDTLTIAPLENPGWNPLSSLTPEGFRYFMPGLIRVQIEAVQGDAAVAQGWYYLSLLDFHLRDPESAKFSLFSASESQLVAEFYEAVLSSPGFAAFFSLDGRLQRSAQAWRARANRSSG